MNHELIDRYIYAVTKNLPHSIRKDVAAELMSIISDMLDERCGEVSPTDKDIRVVLAELGTPSELSEKYDPEKKKCLIGSPYYSTYKFVLKVVIICTAFGMAISGLITQIIEPMAPWYVAVLQWFGMMFYGIIFAFTFITVLFAVFYHKEVRLYNSKDSLDSLPPVPKGKETIHKWESIFGIAFSIFFITVFLFAPQIFCAIFPDSNEFIPIFNIATVKSSWYIIVLFGGIGVIKETVKLIEGRYNNKVMVTTIIANFLSVILAFSWLLNENIINPTFTSGINNMFKWEGGFILGVFGNFQYFFLGIILFALVIDTITTVFNTLRSKNNQI